MLLFIHNNPVSVADGLLHVDRKFHTGMIRYADTLQCSIVSVNPLARSAEGMMDRIALPVESLPYRVVPLELTRRGEPTPESFRDLEAEIVRNELTVGYGYGASDIARKHGRKFIACLEYDFQTQLTIARSFARSLPHAVWSMAKCTASYARTMIPAMRHAEEVHCNGYPIYNASAKHNTHRLLYLDSRMSQDMMIPQHELESRLQSRPGRPLRLLFSGRFEKMKGALDAVMAAAVCRRRGLDVEMDCYGSGSLESAMRETAREHSPWIRIHEPVPFPDLVARSKEADLFVCCHIQSDPSCTYIEAMGCGLPIVGYANRMWTAMAAASDAGRVSPANTPDSIASLVLEMTQAPEQLAALSRNARRFAMAHSFEKQFELRTSAIAAALGRVPR